jgi:hypothetical protein
LCIDVSNPRTVQRLSINEGEDLVVGRDLSMREITQESHHGVAPAKVAEGEFPDHPGMCEHSARLEEPDEARVACA